MVRLENPTGGVVQVDAELAKTLKTQGWKTVTKRGKASPAEPVEPPVDEQPAEPAAD